MVWWIVVECDGEWCGGEQCSGVWWDVEGCGVALVHSFSDKPKTQMMSHLDPVLSLGVGLCDGCVESAMGYLVRCVVGRGVSERL